MLAVRLLLALASPAIGDVLPPHFSQHLRCPFAKVWLEHGAERAAEILGVTPHRRLTSYSAVDVWGSCKYSMSFAGDICMEFHSSQWTDATAKARCDGVSGTLAKGVQCDTAGEFAGYCSTKGGTEITTSFLSAAASTCDAAKNACVTWSQGTFMDDGKCSGGSQQTPDPVAGMSATNGTMSGGQHAGAHSYPASNSGGTMGGTMCLLAPGAMGAAHQLAMSAGYSDDCPGMPGQQSPYMWPLRWSADVESKGLKFGSDEVQYHSKGRVMYMLDKNWKRLDNLYQVGVQRTVGQGPCDQQDSDSSFGCIRNSTAKSTILHRNNKMSFIDYHENGSISSCRWLDLSIIGNIRPDWFMDDRGDSTDVQYLGDSHVYYLGEPKLVKQWRKKDFANQYFTMSMQRLPGADGIHWPLILNVPGEGFGDDFLQHYSNHKTLGESDAELFLIDDAFVEAGGSCPQMASEGSAGPPTGQQAHVPSNLEVQKQSWRSIVWTESPIWTPPVQTDMSTTAGVLTVTPEVSVESCFKETSSTLKMSVNIKMDTRAWAAISWRETEECLMTPRGGGDAELVWANPKSDGTYSLHFGPLSPNMKRFDASAMSTFMGKLSPLQDIPSQFGASAVEYKDGELHFSFERNQSTKPGVQYLNFAFGTSSEPGYHKSRGCFEISALPACKAEKECPTPASPAPPPAAETEASSSGRSLGEKVTGGGAVLTAFGLGAMLR